MHSNNQAAYPSELMFSHLIDDCALQEVHIQLAKQLQTSLKINKILQLFFKTIRQYIPMQGLTYTAEDKQHSVILGIHNHYSANYPLISSHEYIGEIAFTRSTAFNHEEKEHIEILLTALICPLRNALKYQTAIHTALTDPLTKTANRHSLTEQLSREIKISRRYQQPLSLLLIDIDRFKNINDQYGHARGDQALKLVAQHIVTCQRQTDLVFRFGGEEFIVMLTDTDQHGAQITAERTRKFVNTCDFSEIATDLHLSISIGISELTEDDTDESLIYRADQALYQAKDSGRNKVLIAPVPGREEPHSSCPQTITPT